MKNKDVFGSEKFDANDLQNILWDTLSRVRANKLETGKANSVIMAAKEICNIARLKIQKQILEGPITQIEYNKK